MVNAASHLIDSLLVRCVLRDEPGRRKKDASWRIFSLKELQSATNNFNYDNKVGEGGFGSVYWGQLWDGSQVQSFSWTTERIFLFNLFRSSASFWGLAILFFFSEQKQLAFFFCILGKSRTMPSTGPLVVDDCILTDSASSWSAVSSSRLLAVFKI